LNIQEVTTRVRPFSLSDKKVLAEQWKNLEGRANCSVFLSWLWIGQWLELVRENMFVIEAFQNEQAVGLGIFVEKQRKIFGLFPIKQWHLHRTGYTQQDQIWIEHNDFLLASDIADDVRGIMIKALYNYGNKYQEVIIGLSSDKVLNSFHQHFSQSSILIESSGYAVDYSSIEKSYLQEVLSKNTRSQINRSNKILNQLGDLTFKVVTETDEIQSLYNDIAVIHIARWGNTTEGSGFSNEAFVDFHHQLVNNDKSCTVQVVVLLLDSAPIGYLVNYIYNEKVYFYLSAFSRFSNNKIKVGLTLHEKAIGYYASKGIKSYDFLGGEARYKDSLSNTRYGLALNSFYKKYWLLTTERQLKHLKNKIKLLISKVN
jgi:CelD/BcsL family acetyltransferase involved in cellulose biosynthesis